MLAVLVLTLGCAARSVDLEDRLWVLESYGESGNLQQVLENTEITAMFKSEQREVGGSAGCNGYFASYQLAGDKLTLSPVGSTMMECPEPPGVMDQEFRFLSILENAERVQVENNKLTIHSTGNQVLIFRAQ